MLGEPSRARISLIVCIRELRDVAQLDGLLESIKVQSVKPDEIIIATDSKPSAATLSALRSPSFVSTKVVVNHAGGLANARNTGIAGSLGEVVAFIDSDSVADSRWLERLLESYVDPDVAAVGGPAYPRWTFQPPRWFTQTFYWLVGCSYAKPPGSATSVLRLFGCNMSMRREILMSVGLFNPHLGRMDGKPLSGEDTEWFIRLKSTIPPARVLFVPDAVTFQIIPPSRLDFRQLALRALYGGISATLVAKLTRLCEPRTEVAFLTDSLKAFLSSRASARRKTVSAGFAALIVGLEMVGMLMGMLMPIVRTSRTSVCRY